MDAKRKTQACGLGFFVVAPIGIEPISDGASENP
jgi:hypothetical protein